MNNKTLVHLYDFKAISGTEAETNIMTKDGPIALIIKEIPRVLGTMSQELWMKTK